MIGDNSVEVIGGDIVIKTDGMVVEILQLVSSSASKQSTTLSHKLLLGRQVPKPLWQVNPGQFVFGNFGGFASGSS